MPYKDPKQAREYQRQRQRDRRAAGLCLNCATAAVAGETRCEPCKQRRRPLERADKRLRRAGLPVGGPTTAPQPSHVAAGATKRGRVVVEHHPAPNEPL